MKTAQKALVVKKPGQILILVLLIIVVALAVGLSVAARNITNLRTSAQTEQSQRAFTAAEGGVEEVLSKISKVAEDLRVGSGATSNCSVSGVGGEANCSVTVGDINANVTVKSNSNFQSTIELGNVGQIDLAGATGNVQINWAKSGDALETPPATIAVTQYVKSGAVYSQDRKLFQGEFGARPGESGTFDNPGSCTPATGYQKCAVVTLQANAVMLRIRPFWTRASVNVSGNLQTQVYEISSVAKTDSGITRRVQVSRTALPQLPAVFDYVLFSSGDIAK